MSSATARPHRHPPTPPPDNGDGIPKSSSFNPNDLAAFFSPAKTRARVRPTPVAPPLDSPSPSPPASPDNSHKPTPVTLRARFKLPGKDAILDTGAPPSTVRVKGKARAGAGTPTRSALRIDSLPEKYMDRGPTSPILPKVKLSFPIIFSDDEDEDSSPWVSTTDNSPNLSPKPSHRRSWSQTTTTTRRTTERRSWRYSMPSFSTAAAAGDVDPPIFPAEPAPPPSQSRATHRHSYPSAYASSPSSKVPFPRSSSPSLPPSSGRRSSTSASSSPRRGVPRRPATSFPGYASSPSNPKVSSTRPMASFFPTSSSSNSSPPAYHRRSHSYPYQAQFFATGGNAATAPPPLDPAASHLSTLTSAALEPYVKPFMNLLFFLTISAVAFCSISAVLVAGFTLTFFDDCEQRVRSVRKGIAAGQRRVKGGIEDVLRSGTGARRMIEDAMGRVTWSAIGVKRLVGSSLSGPTFAPPRVGVDFVASSDEASPSPPPSSSSSTSSSESPTPRPQTPVSSSSAQAAGSGQGPNRTSVKEGLKAAFATGRPASSPGPRGRSRTPHRRRSSHSPCISRSKANSSTSQPGTPVPPFGERPEGGEAVDVVWTSDEEVPPYSVPNPTPYTSRPGSPSRNPNKNRTNNLPRRPPLRILVPSVFLALVYTFWKLLQGYWSSAPKKGGKKTGNSYKGKGKQGDSKGSPGTTSPADSSNDQSRTSST